jgi:hypothetical protein
MAEQGGSSDVLTTGQVLIAPEVVQLEFQYYNGSEAVDSWSMQEQSTMPAAVEVRIWLADSGSTSAPVTYSNSSAPKDAQMYSETIDLPLAAATGAPASASSSDSSSDSSSNSGSTGTGSSGQSTSNTSKSTAATSKTTPSMPNSKTPIPNLPGKGKTGR